MIDQEIILRKSEMAKAPEKHEVELVDIETFKWDGKKGRWGFDFAFCVSHFAK